MSRLAPVIRTVHTLNISNSDLRCHLIIEFTTKVSPRINPTFLNENFRNPFFIPLKAFIELLKQQFLLCFSQNKRDAFNENVLFISIA